MKTANDMQEEQGFRLRPISDFLQGGKDSHFYIPSYQRGYRWESREVEYLLNDLASFSENESEGSFYCLQPIVVKSRQWEKDNQTIDGWEVIDGQQRLTTLRLILEMLQPGSDWADSSLYDITYQTRPELSLSNIDRPRDIDSFYMDWAKRTILEWKKKVLKEGNISLSRVRESLFLGANKRVAKVIWYEDPSEEQLESIHTFNNLNKGKISLTSSELIKALFVLHYKKNGKAGELSEILAEWHLMEKTLQNDSLWYFLTNTEYTPSTRIDLIFDFLVEKPQTEEGDYAYHQFQKLYENKLLINGYTFATIWDGVKRVFYTFMFWYENRELFHYIGFLVCRGFSLTDIYKKIKNTSKDMMVKSVKDMIKEKLKINEQELKDMKYGNDKILPVLLLLNIETSISMDNYRFDFKEYKKEKHWDIEHIASQTKNTMQRTRDKIVWLKYLNETTPETQDLEAWSALQEKANALLNKLEEGGSDDKNDEFNPIYEESFRLTEDPEMDEDNKNKISNLTLLDSGTNRGYGNSLFPTKRKCILANDNKGRFTPPSTKYVFLKYYTADDTSTSQWKNQWTVNDADKYFAFILKTLGYYLN